MANAIYPSLPTITSASETDQIPSWNSNAAGENPETQTRAQLRTSMQTGAMKEANNLADATSNNVAFRNMGLTQGYVNVDSAGAGITYTTADCPSYIQYDGSLTNSEFITFPAFNIPAGSSVPKSPQIGVPFVHFRHTASVGASTMTLASDGFAQQFSVQAGDQGYIYATDNSADGSLVCVITSSRNLLFASNVTSPNASINGVNNASYTRRGEFLDVMLSINFTPSALTQTIQYDLFPFGFIPQFVTNTDFAGVGTIEIPGSGLDNAVKNIRSIPTSHSIAWDQETVNTGNPATVNIKSTLKINS